MSGSRNPFVLVGPMGWDCAMTAFFTALFGMGLGTYPRIVLAHRPDGQFPSNFVVEHDGGYPLLSLRAGLPTYVGEKISVEPGLQYHLFVSLRSPDGKARCRSACAKNGALFDQLSRHDISPLPPRDLGGFWGSDFQRRFRTGRCPRLAQAPVELALFNSVPDSTIQVGHVRMLDARGRDIPANGDFSRGTERWYFIDEQHRIWRIENQYLMSFFEGGALGLTSFILFAGAALAKWSLLKPRDCPNSARPRFSYHQPRSSSVPIRSAGHTRLSGALVSASTEGLLPAGRSTM
jgi:hypothetical protein